MVERRDYSKFERLSEHTMGPIGIALPQTVFGHLYSVPPNWKWSNGLNQVLADDYGAEKPAREEKKPAIILENGRKDGKNPKQNGFHPPHDIYQRGQSVWVSSAFRTETHREFEIRDRKFEREACFYPCLSVFIHGFSNLCHP